MSDMQGAVPGPDPAGPPVQSEPAWRKILFNRVELRAGWRLLIFCAIMRVFFLVILAAQKRFSHAPSKSPHSYPISTAIGEGIAFFTVLLACAIMAKIEKRKLGDYGLPAHAAFGRQFWIGTVWGFLALTGLLLIMGAAHDFSFGPLALHGSELIYFAVMWGIGFLMVGFAEEFIFRGYVLFTLTTGLGFWPAALLLSFLFGYAHSNNPGETRLGLTAVVMIALFFCFTLWKTGALWFAVGFHAAWDWAETFFYGTPDSGFVAPGHLLNSSFHGSKWITGGTVGPEGSAIVVPLIAALFVLFHLSFRKRAEYPALEAKKAAEAPTPV